jgi:hypothetical protein
MLKFRGSLTSGSRERCCRRMGFLSIGIMIGVSHAYFCTITKADDLAQQNPLNDLAPSDSWQQANELLATGGSLTDVTYHLENYLRRGRATLESQSQMPVSDVEAWSLLGRVHAMNEKEDKALAAFEAGRKALEAGHGGANIAGEMLTVSPPLKQSERR